MITVYVEADNISSEITNISLDQLRTNYFKATLNDPIIDLTKLDHYFLFYNEKNDTYTVEYNEEKYNEMINKKEKEEAIQLGNKKLEEIQLQITLDHASDSDAYTMRYLYDEWKSNIKYKIGDRRLYKDILYKCKQNHTSQEQHTPDLIPAIWDIINGDTEKGTKDNPIPVPDVVSSMVYVKGKYYIESGKIYLMNREGMKDGDEISLNYKPSQLVGHYFEIVN